MIADAKAELQQALDLDRSFCGRASTWLGLYFDQGLSEKAREQLERGLKQSPGLPSFFPCWVKSGADSEILAPLWS